jgi:hypothetical protein
MHMLNTTHTTYQVAKNHTAKATAQVAWYTSPFGCELNNIWCSMSVDAHAESTHTTDEGAKSCTPQLAKHQCEKQNSTRRHTLPQHNAHAAALAPHSVSASQLAKQRLIKHTARIACPASLIPHFGCHFRASSMRQLRTYSMLLLP